MGGPVYCLGGMQWLTRLLLLAWGATVVLAWEPPLPRRDPNAATGSDLVRQWQPLSLAGREAAAVAEVRKGNVPLWWRSFVDVRLGPAVLHVAPDYLAVGSDDDFIRMPLSPAAAQAVADALDCTLPTPKIVDAVFQAAARKLEPQPMPPGPEMTTPAQFARHNDMIESALRAAPDPPPRGILVAGHKKDVVLTPRLASAPGRVAIYGWHRGDGTPIQPLFLGHAESWVDYSHGVRLVARQAAWGDSVRSLDDIAADDRWWILLSDEGPLAPLRFGEIKPRVPDHPGEAWETLFFPGGVRALIGRPEAMDPREPPQLVVYTVPAGNSIEQTLGRALRRDDDWHFDIQHVAAQARWLRSHGRPNLVLAVLQPARGSWVTWTRDNERPGEKFAGMLGELRRKVPGARLTLASHSAGGSAVFSLLEFWEAIPPEVERIAFLDSNYRYDPARGHAARLSAWLKGGGDRRLVVMAYEDFRARIDGVPFVTEKGGTWGRSLAMRDDLAVGVGGLTLRQSGPLEDYRDSGGRAVLLLRHNPEGAIWHTRLVELNGFIHSMLAGTSGEGRGYDYLAPRVYGDLVGR